MTFRFTLRVNSEGMTVPYASITDHIRRNRGFVDLRRHPDRATEIAEGKDSPALRNLLVRLANVGSAIFTLGCDLGTHQEATNVPLGRREVAGGYIHFASVHYDRAEPEAYTSFANAIGKSVKARAAKDHWDIECIGTWVNFVFDGKPKGIRPSLQVWFFAAARDGFAAMQSRERLIEAIDTALHYPQRSRHLHPSVASRIGLSALRYHWSKPGLVAELENTCIKKALSGAASFIRTGIDRVSGRKPQAL